MSEPRIVRTAEEIALRLKQIDMMMENSAEVGLDTPEIVAGMVIGLRWMLGGEEAGAGERILATVERVCKKLQEVKAKYAAKEASAKGTGKPSVH